MVRKKLVDRRARISKKEQREITDGGDGAQASLLTRVLG